MEWIVAHQGGWDEILMFVVPVVIAIVAVKWAERRGARKREALEDVIAERHTENDGT